MISANVVEELYGAGWIRDDVQVKFFVSTTQCFDS